MCAMPKCLKKSFYGQAASCDTLCCGKYEWRQAGGAFLLVEVSSQQFREIGNFCLVLIWMIIGAGQTNEKQLFTLGQFTHITAASGDFY